MTENNQAQQSYRLQKQLLIEQRLSGEGKSAAIAYILWALLGLFGAPRFYLRQTGTAIAMLILTLTVFGTIISTIWWLIDAFLIPGIARNYNDALRQKLAYQIL
ncbi:TM2 domain-containing protein [Candidatus Tokpelaia sp.]|uniref:TM2 domain-containing protein n=1 Tax=Candidatus Tokpelaia sp. TaxID=2233777 RepID=UPI0012393C35|nr:TM2 domain-containing protein [Candidatus Tokpelaia sp.]KAA6405369.1 hypothetical protein DPQ22_04725 [Candidatus Tokpelaia sp.]